MPGRSSSWGAATADGDGRGDRPQGGTGAPWRNVGRCRQAPAAERNAAGGRTVLATGGSNSSGFNAIPTDDKVLDAEIWDPQTEQWRQLGPDVAPAPLPLDGAAPARRAGPLGRAAATRRPAASPTTLRPRSSRRRTCSIWTARRRTADHQRRPGERATGRRSPWAPAGAAARTGHLDPALVGDPREQQEPADEPGSSFSATGSGLTVVAPASGIEPPGHYMLLMDSNGVPSEGKIIRIFWSGGPVRSLRRVPEIVPAGGDRPLRSTCGSG